MHIFIVHRIDMDFRSMHYIKIYNIIIGNTRHSSFNEYILTAEYFHLQQMCIESSTLLPPGDNELFTPMTVHAGKEPLKGCVLSIR